MIFSILFFNVFLLQVGLVTFNSEAETPPGEKSSSTCYKNELATAVGVNLKYLKKYMRNIKTEGKKLFMYIKF